MSEKKSDPLWTLLGILFKSHPWHGVPLGPEAPEVVTAYIEIVPTDTVKYELDKITGHLKVDRPQRYSNVCPSLYGLIPQTYCSDRIGALCAQLSQSQPAVSHHLALLRHGGIIAPRRLVLDRRRCRCPRWLWRRAWRCRTR